MMTVIIFVYFNNQLISAFIYYFILESVTCFYDKNKFGSTDKSMYFIGLILILVYIRIG